MKKRIEQLLNGKFEYGIRGLRLSENSIEQTAEADSVLSGSFSAVSIREKKVKGFVYSSNPRVTFLPEQFDAAMAQIRYQADTTGLSLGDVIEGDFTLCTEVGEYHLPYRFTVSGAQRDASPAAPRMISTAEGLLSLATEDLSGAYAVFSSEGFLARLEEKEPARAALLSALVKTGCSPSSMEEFLVGCGMKEPVEISLEETEVHMDAPERSGKYSVRMQRSGWGYLEMTMESDSRFLRLEKKTLTTEAFAGGRYELEYIVDTNFLHPGKNLGRISIRSCYQTLSVEVTVEKSVRGRGGSERTQKLMRKKMLELYLDLRLKKIEMQAWLDRSFNVLGGYRRAGGDDVFADLFMIQLLFADGKRIRAQHLLEEIEHHPQRLKTMEQYAFFLYLSTFFQREGSYVDQVEARIEQLFLQNRNSWIIQWILLYLQERYMKDDSARLEAILAQISAGCSSPIMYLEAAAVYRKNPFLLRSLEREQRLILLFAARRGIITEELSFQIGNLAQRQEQFDRMLYIILEHCYQLTGSADILRVICQMLIGGRKTGKEYFRWYALGVDEDLRLTGLYEYYMMTMDDVGIEKMPQVIRMYFSYSRSLDYHRKAAIYRDVSDNRESVPQVYQNCRSGIDRFITEQLSLGRIDENLAVLYERFITRRLLTRSGAEKLTRLLFTFEVSCKNPAMEKVIVIHPDLSGEQEAPLADGRARVLIYAPDARILLQDGEGKRYASASLYRVARFLDSPLLLTYCREICPEHPALAASVCLQGREIDSQNLPFFRQACEQDMFTRKKRRLLRRRVLDYYVSHTGEEDVYGWLKSIPLPAYAEADRTKLISLLTQEGMYEQAFYILEHWGTEKVPVPQLVRICSQSVLSLEYEENPLLLAYCYQCFTYGKDDDHILNYLLMYYDGPIEKMKQLWVTGHANDMDTMALEEKILSMILFTRSGSEGTEQIFASYQRKLGKKKLCRAYVILKSYEYLILSLPVNDLIFGYIEQGLRKGAEQEDICVLALLRYYSRMGELDEERSESVSSLLARYDAMGVRLAFYKNFPRQLRLPLQMEDRVLLEYIADPNHQVMISYRFQGEKEFVREPMKLGYECVFIREFIVFEPEVLECFIEEISRDEVVKKTDHMYLQAHVPEGMEGSRFDMIGKMTALEKEGRQEELDQMMHSYEQMDHLTKEIFTLV